MCEGRKEVEYSGERGEEERTLKNFYRVIKRKSDSDLSWGTTLDIKPDPDLLHLAITHSGDEQIKIVINFNFVFLTSVNWTYRGWGELCRLIWPQAINTTYHAIGSAIDIRLSDWCVSIIIHLNCDLSLIGWILSRKLFQLCSHSLLHILFYTKSKVSNFSMFPAKNPFVQRFVHLLFL